MNMNDMMGLLQQLKQRMNPEPGSDPGKGPGSMQIPNRLGGSIVNKDAPVPSSSGAEPTRGELAGQIMMGGAADDIQALQQMIARLRQQMAKPGISADEQASLMQQIQQLEAQAQQLFQQAQDNMRMRPQGDGMVLRMGTSSSRGNPGYRDRLPGWLAGPVGGYGGGGMGAGSGGGLSDPFGWMGQSRQGGALDWAGNPVGSGVTRVSGGKRKKR